MNLNTQVKIDILNQKGEKRGEILLANNPLHLSVQMKTEEESRGLWELLQIMGMESRGIRLIKNGQEGYVTLDDGFEKFSQALAAALQQAGLDVRLYDQQGKEIKIVAKPPPLENEFEYI